MNGETKHFSEVAPEGTPTVSDLADFWKRGYMAAKKIEQPVPEPTTEELVSLADMAESRGRPVDSESEREGQEAATLKKLHKDWTFKEIAKQVCRYRTKRYHHCRKACKDRIRQALLQHRTREELKRIARGDSDS